ncbi:MAG: hypothetical protein Q9160_008617 [Pyrenula sp. 1 TL-2023]
MADVTPSSTPKSYSSDSTLYLYTSLTAGSSHIITATSRLETILKANRIPFKALDVATDEKARMLWGRRSKGRKLPGLVRYGSIVGDLEEIEEWNEFGELKQQIGSIPATSATPVNSTTNSPSKVPAKAPTPSEPAPATPAKETTNHSPDKLAGSVKDGEPKPAEPMKDGHSEAAAPETSEKSDMTLTMRQLGAEAARRAGEKKSLKRETMASKPSDQSQITAAGATNAKAGIDSTIDKVTSPTDESQVEEISKPEESLETAPIKPEESVKSASATATENREIMSGVSENAMSSSSSLQPDDTKGTTSSHRGSTVKTDVPESAIEEVEKELVIPEAEENADSIPEPDKSKATPANDVGSSSDKLPVAGKEDADNAGTSANKTEKTQVTSTSQAEAPTAEGAKTQDQEAKEGDAATASVGD